MSKHTQPTLPAGPESMPERVTVAVAELASAAREGLLALAVGTGIGVLGELPAADVDRLVGPKGRHNPDRAAVRHGTQRGRLTIGGAALGSLARGWAPLTAPGSCRCRPGRRSVAVSCWVS